MFLQVVWLFLEVTNDSDLAHNIKSQRCVALLHYYDRGSSCMKGSDL